MLGGMIYSDAFMTRTGDQSEGTDHWAAANMGSHVSQHLMLHAPTAPANT